MKYIGTRKIKDQIDREPWGTEKTRREGGCLGKFFCVGGGGGKKHPA